MASSSVRTTTGLIAGLVLVPSVAFAQETPPPTTPAPTTTEPVVEPAPPPTTPATPATTPATPAQPPEPPNDGHFRWGLSPMFGTFFPGPTTIALGFEGRFGYAFNQMVTAYGNVCAVGGIGFGGDVDEKSGTSVSVSAISYWQIGANVDALLAGPFFVGGGAGFGKAGWGVVEANASSTGGGSRVIAAGGWAPSLDGRLGISTGSPNPQTGKRTGFYLALDVRVLFAPDSTETTTRANTNGTGSASVVTDTTAIGISPMLHLGFDSR